MRIGIIVGSHRKKSASQKVARYLEQTLSKVAKDASFYTFDLSGNPLPLWDEDVWAKSEHWQKIWNPISRELKACDGFVIIAPEWSGMVPAGLKNFFLLCGDQELAHKPGMIVGVSSAGNGHYPVIELRSSSYKNTRICYVPDHVIVKNCEHVLIAPDSDAGLTADDRYIRERLVYSLGMLTEYARAFTPIRESGRIDTAKFPFGM